MGYFQRAMRGYVTWLSQQTEQLPDRVHKIFIQQREFIRARCPDGHDRAPEAVACILTGYQFMLQYFARAGALEQDEIGGLMIEAMNAMVAVSEKQTREMESEKPTRIFLNVLVQLLRSRQAGVRDLTMEEPKDPGGLTKMIGYRDREYYYLLPDVAHSLVAALCRTQGVEFPVSLKALYKHLRTDGILPPFAGSGDSYTRNKWIDGVPTRLLWIPVSQIDGSGKPSEQMGMNLAALSVSDEEIPEAWKDKE